jgi:hypothetical protein
LPARLNHPEIVPKTTGRNDAPTLGADPGLGRAR